MKEDFTINKGGQSTQYEEHLVLKGEKIRITIKSDSYDFQSYAKAWVFNRSRLEWAPIASLHYGDMETPTGLAYKASEGWRNAGWYSADRCALIDRILWVLEN